MIATAVFVIPTSITPELTQQLKTLNKNSSTQDSEVVMDLSPVTADTAQQDPLVDPRFTD